ncbi:MAG: hypothetical protein KDD89_00235 [Anaerolineales bacterium]|nr:hypothetical protein [Anaerolineales bacterium]
MTQQHGLGNLDDLFQQAQQDGLTDNTLDLVIANLNGPTMTQPVGQSLDQLASTDITLAMNIIDMSGSMAPRQRPDAGLQRRLFASHVCFARRRRHSGQHHFVR